MVELFLNGLGEIARLDVIFFMVLGVVLGTLAGAIPGLNAGVVIALMLPVTYRMEFLPSLVFLTSIYTGGIFGGSITAILINIPGAPASMATVFDGHAMTVQGKSNEALGYSIGASVIGGIFGMIFLYLTVMPLARFALKFGPAEMFMLVVFAMVSIASVSKGSLLKGLVSGMFGILLGTIGMTESGSIRMTFDCLYLIDGLPLVPTLIGFIGFSELFFLMEREYISDSSKVKARDAKKILKGVCSVPKYVGNLFSSSLVGIIVGALPGIGATVASLISYDLAKKFSKRPETFGNGAPEGVVAAESANNASQGGAMATMLALGIPGGTATAILIGAFMVKGLIPGPRLVIDNLQIIYTLLVANLFEQFVLLVVGILAAMFLVKVLEIPTKILIPVITVTCLVGAFTVRNLLFDSALLFVFGVIGWAMKKQGYSLPAVIIGAILAPIADTQLMKAYLISGGNMGFLFSSPMSIVLFVLVLGALGMSVRASLKERANSVSGA